MTTITHSLSSFCISKIVLKIYAAPNNSYNTKYHNEDSTNIADIILYASTLPPSSHTIMLVFVFGKNTLSINKPC